MFGDGVFVFVVVIMFFVGVVFVFGDVMDGNEF